MKPEWSAAALDLSGVRRPGAFLGGITSRVRTLAAGLLRATRGTLLDVGCGNALLFAEAGGGPGLTMIGVDQDPRLLREARGVLADNGVHGVRLVRGDAFALPFRPGSADAVALLNTLVNLPSEAQAQGLLKSLMAICKPGGRVVFDIRNRANPLLRVRYAVHGLRADFTTRGHGLGWVRRVCEECGFELVRAEPIGPGWMPWAYLLEARAQSAPLGHSSAAGPDPAPGMSPEVRS